MDLRDYIEKLRPIGELREVRGADWDLEIGAITELAGEREGPVLLFDEIKDYPRGFRVLTNFLNNPKHVNVAFGFQPALSTLELVRSVKEKFARLKPIAPKEVGDGPVLENVEEGGDVDMFKFPSPKWHQRDGGRYIGTGCMVIMKDSEGGWVNAGTYRLQLHDGHTLGSHISPGHQGNLIRENYWAKGKSCPVAVVFGIHPLVWIPSMLAFPWGTSELEIAGGLLGRPLEVIRGEFSGLPIPCDAEIAIEGECPPPDVESREEGPFGEWTGYYASGARNNPVIKVKRVMYRNDPILLGAAPLKPPASGYSTPLWRAVSLWQDLEDMGIPGIKGVWQMRSGGSRFISVISIEQRYAGHAKQVGTAAMSTPEGAYNGRFIIVVEEDIDPTKEGDVIWAVATRCDPASSIEIINDCWSTPLDPLMPPDKREKKNFTNSRAIVNACRPFHWKDKFPEVNRASDETRSKTLKKWEDLFDSM